MNTEQLDPVKIEEKDPVEFDDIMTFKVNRTEKKNFQKATGRMGAEYMRQAMRQITRQLTEPEAQAS
jgi:uncharacterized protein YqkB